MFNVNLLAFDHILHRGEHCLKRFCESLREHAKNIIDFEKKNMFSLTRKEQNDIKMQRNVAFVKQNLQKNFQKIKTIKKLENITIV